MDTKQKVVELNNFLNLIESVVDNNDDPWFIMSHLMETFDIKAHRGISDACFYILASRTSDEELSEEARGKLNEISYWLDLLYGIRSSPAQS